ncbi:unnamed protein product [Auanema sp. JU1783]|nr:unnamed protein product [Auanema sp. JU1783]
MLVILWLIIREFLLGVYHSLTGLTLIFKLDRDVKHIIVNAAAADKPDRFSVLAQRRTINGVVERPAEPIVRYNVPAWMRILYCILGNMLCMFVFWIFSGSCSFFISLFFEKSEILVEATTSLLVFPIFLILRVLMILWFSDIASACNRTLRMPEGRPIDIRTAIADLGFSAVLGFVFLFQAILVGYILLPIPGLSSFIKFIHMSLLNAMYSFEYFWTSRGFSLSERLHRLHSSWPYYVGFGSLLTLATSFTGNFIFDGCLFGALFPFTIISSYQNGTNVTPIWSVLFRQSRCCIHRKL